MPTSMKTLQWSKVVRVALIASLVAVLWLAGARTLFAVPRVVQDFVLTTNNDFLPGTFVRTGLVSNGDGAVQLMPVGLTGQWITDTQQLPAVRAQLAVVSAGSRIYALGGVDNLGLPQRQVYMSSVVSNNLSAWVTQTNSLPIGLAAQVGLVATAGGVTRIYLVGGFDELGVYSNKIYYAPLGSDGTVGTWLTSTNSLPVGLAFATGVVNKGRIYVLGGIQGDGSYRTETYSMVINSDGTLAAATPEPALPSPLALSAAVVYNGVSQDTLFVLGGATSPTTNTNSVLFADVTGGGSLTSWTESAGVLPDAFSSHAAIQANGQIYVIAGNSGGQSSNLQPRTTVLSALIDENSSRRLVDFGGGTTWLQSDPLPNPLRFLGAAIIGSTIFTVGGDTSNNPFSVAPTRYSYHGSIEGAAARYAPTGNYLSPVINVGAPIPMTQFAWSAVRTDTSALDLQLRYRTSNDNVNWSAWSALMPSNASQSANITDAKPITYSLNVTAQYFQAQAFFTSTNSTLTPYLTEVHLFAGVPSSDLAVSKSFQPPAVLQGSNITYTIAYTNLVGSAVSNVILTETLPANTTYVNTGAGWAQVGASSQYMLSTGSLGAGSSRTATFVVRVNPSLPAQVRSITNTVAIGGDPSETNLSNNNFSTVTPIGNVVGVDLSVTKDDSYVTPRAGQVLTYTISYYNYGTDDAPNVTLTETLPAQLSFVGSGWTSIGGNRYTRSLGTVAGGASGTIDFAALVNASTPGGTYLTNTVAIGFPGADVNSGNNTAQDVDYITQPNLRAYKYDEAAVVTPNQTLVYNLTVVNIGGAIANNVVMTETPPLSLVQVLSAPGWTQNGSVWVKSVGSLAPGATLNDTFTVRVLNSAPNGSVITNTLRVSAANQDPAQTTGLTSSDVNIVSTGAPDLQIASTWPAVAVANQAAQFHALINNAGAGPATTWFFTDMYVRAPGQPPPANRSELGEAFSASGSGLAPGESRVVDFNWTFGTAGTYWLYYQIDTCDTSSVGPSGVCFDPSYGRIPESNELNNVYGPITVTVYMTTPKQLYLPLINR